MSPTVSELWIYPIKACQGVRIASAAFCSDGGLENDRIFCVVDLEGARHPACEALSQRKLPPLALINVQIESDGEILRLSAPGAGDVCVPMDEKALAAEEFVEVQCGGRDTITGKGWDLGTVAGRSAGKAAEKWLSALLNPAERVDPFAEEASDRPPARYVLVRAVSSRCMSGFVGPTAERNSAAVERRGFDMPDIQVAQHDAVRFQDFAPLLITSEDSLSALQQELMAAPRRPKDYTASMYPMSSFRPSVVLRDVGHGWAEEEWQSIATSGAGELRFLKVCPRCTVPCRDQTTGGFVVSGYPLLPTATLGKMFPDKRTGYPEWGSWQGPIFGAYFAHSGRGA